MPEVRAVLNPDLYEHVSAKAKAAGITKAKWVAYLIQQDMNSPKVTEIDSDRIVGAKAKIILVENAEKLRWLKEDYQVIWYEGFIWFVGKTANGTQVQLERWMEYPETLFNGLEKTRWRAYSAAQVKEALERWNELKAMEYIDDLPESQGRFGFFGDVNEFFGKYGQEYEKLKQRAIKAIEAYKAAMQAPTAVEEPVKDEVAAEAIAMPQPPYLEPVVEQLETPIVETAPQQLATSLGLPEEPKPLTKEQFRKKFRFGFDKAGNEAYGKACVKGRAKGWVADDRSKWFTTADSKDGRWSTDKSAVSPVTRELVKA